MYTFDVDCISVNPHHKYILLRFYTTEISIATTIVIPYLLHLTENKRCQFRVADFSLQF